MNESKSRDNFIEMNSALKNNIEYTTYVDSNTSKENFLNMLSDNFISDQNNAKINYDYILHNNEIYELRQIIEKLNNAFEKVTMILLSDIEKLSKQIEELHNKIGQI